MNDTLFTDQTDRQIESHFQELVGEGKKFKTEEDLARSKYESDRYIETLVKRLDDFREENDRLREEANARAALTDILDQMKQEKLSSSESTPLNVTNETKPINPQDIENIVQKKLLEIERSKREEQNLNIVRNKLTENYGPNYGSYLREKTKQLGLTEEFVDNMARNYPEVLFKTLDLNNVTQSPVSPPRTSQRNDNFSPNVNKRTWSYYQKMKKENPVQYAKKETTLQMHRDAIELGDAFRDGDW